jgi:uncharacterized protein
MHQNWRRLLFLHWAWDAAAVQATLPPGLTVETCDGRAWLGVISFKMESVRPRFCPAIPGISDFPELNVRTYVRDQQGRSGVWFYSLDCAQPLAVWTARTFFGLPYFHAQMSEQVAERIFYRCRREGFSEVADFEYRGLGEVRRANRETIEEFLVERYRLFAARRGRLLTGEVWHEPYLLQEADVERWSVAPLKQAGFDPESRPPDHAIFSPGVDTRIFGVEPVGSSV